MNDPDVKTLWKNFQKNFTYASEFEWSDSEPNCTFYMVSNAGHNSNQDNPDEVNEHIERYLTQLTNYVSFKIEKTIVYD